MKKSKNKPKNKLSAWYEELDLQTWWEEFATATNENGTLRYATVWAFITGKTKDPAKRKLLWWILGPIGKSEEYKNYAQFDWEVRREKGHWYNSANIGKLQKEVTSHRSALDSMREVGKVTIKTIERIEALATEIDREYSGRIFLASLSAKENMLRSKHYFSLLDQLQQMMDRAIASYGKTQGIDIDRLDQFFQLFGPAMGQAAANLGLSNGKVIEGNQAVGSTAINKIAQMIADKAARFELDLPDSDMNAIVTNSMKPTLVSTKG